MSVWQPTCVIPGETENPYSGCQVFRAFLFVGDYTRSEDGRQNPPRVWVFAFLASPTGNCPWGFFRFWPHQFGTEASMCYSFHKKAVVAKDSKAITCELSCHNWHCKDCGKVKQRAWLERFKNFAELACHFEITVHRSKLARDSFVRKLRRHYCHYMIVRIDNRYEIFHTPIYGNCQFKPDRSKWFTPAKMLWNAKSLLDMAVSVKHHVRITASRSVPKSKR